MVFEDLIKADCLHHSCSDPICQDCGQHSAGDQCDQLVVTYVCGFRVLRKFFDDIDDVLTRHVSFVAGGNVEIYCSDI